MDREHVTKVRLFSRQVTQRIGVLQESYLSRGRPLGEARLLFEIGVDGREVRDLRSALNLDSAYLSRLLRSLEAQGLVTVEQQAGDGRVRRATLTAKGRIEFDSYDRLSDELAQSLLSPLTPAQRSRLIAAMDEVRNLLAVAPIEIAVVPPQEPDARWCLDRYFEELAQRFESGFDRALGKSPSDAEMTPPAGFFLVARSDGAPVGCAALVRLSAETMEIKRMWTAPLARGRGVARRMLGELERLAREAGCRKILLDTNRSLTEAQTLYRRQGFVETARYNDNPYADFWFEKDLAG
ncbi:bifunctional helix-turn-helix transcriptional regulator/GNAT family N-acetyltransferase [Aquamicrobium soli]|uniref:bifunctional helix-turn-helix transcriptional regulator/GNAT family N-acetyltransferase n=1 Tax=Aquamicrobium soli TaxID=1811518 RepID=UPI00366ACCDD